MRFKHAQLFQLILLLVLCGSAGAAAAVSAPAAWAGALVHTGWGVREGAPSNIFDMTQDQLGMLWLPSVEGLYRFDGIRFERLGAIDGNRLHSASTNCVLSVGSALWVGYNFGGVSVFDGGRVRHYGVADGLQARSVHRLVRTGDGHIWAATVDRLYRFDGQRWHAVMESDGLPRGRVTRLTGWQDGSLLAFHPDGDIYRNSPGGQQFQRIFSSHGLQPRKVLPNGDALFSDHLRNFFRYSAASNTLSPLRFPAGVQPVDPFLDNDGGVWVNPDTGLMQLGPDLRPLRVFKGLESLSGKQIFSTFVDREGNLWLSTENGIDRIRSARLTNISLPDRMWRSLSVQSDGDGTIWVGNHRNDVDEDYRVASFGVLKDGSRTATPMYDVTASTRAADGSVWFANSATLWHRDAGRWKSWPLPDGLRGSEVQALAMADDGRLWVSVVGKGVHVFHEGRWQPGGDHPALAKRTAVRLYADGQGQLWLAYPDSRLAVLSNGKLREYGREDGLDVGNVTAIASRNGKVWVGGDEGVAQMQGQRFSPLLDADGQSLNGVSAILISSRGELWLNGVSGVVRIAAPDLASGKVTRLDRFDYLDGRIGKPHHMRPLSALTEASDGRMWFATSGSVGWIDTSQIPHSQRVPTPQVTALRTEQREHVLRPGLVLPARTSNLELDFTAATLSMPERVRFRYRLVGLEDDWREAGTRRAAFYTNLGPGNYRFEVLASNEDGRWGTVPAQFAFSIAPTFVQTAWFKVLCAMLALLFLALLYWRRMISVTARISERLRERLRERERIARTLHDSFLQSVQALMMQFDLIKHGLAPSNPLYAKIESALTTAEDVLREGREQVLELRLNHEQTGDLETALAGLGEILGPRYETRFTLDVTGEPQPFRASAAAEAYAISREAMLNAFRHARSPEVRVELRYERSQFALLVSDHGRGMDAKVYERGHRPGHFGLTGMRERADDVGGTLEIHSARGQGTTVKLLLPARRAYARNALEAA